MIPSPVLERLDAGIRRFRLEAKGDIPTAIRCSRRMMLRITDENGRARGVQATLAGQETYRGIPLIRSIEVDEECVELVETKDHGNGWKTTNALLVTVFVEGEAA